uniref:Uncharacterized protein n=2 Tax=Amorphochlora amoebiformis TaxID=1561963 RepID=A0A0H5BKK4_9EUKA|nr:hypothetical protein [Amorphochlora amoebiformis]
MFNISFCINNKSKALWMKSLEITLLSNKGLLNKTSNTSLITLLFQDYSAYQNQLKSIFYLMILTYFTISFYLVNKSLIPFIDILIRLNMIECTIYQKSNYCKNFLVDFNNKKLFILIIMRKTGSTSKKESNLLLTLWSFLSICKSGFYYYFSYSMFKKILYNKKVQNNINNHMNFTHLSLKNIRLKMINLKINRYFFINEIMMHISDKIYQYLFVVSNKFNENLLEIAFYLFSMVFSFDKDVKNTIITGNIRLYINVIYDFVLDFTNLKENINTNTNISYANDPICYNYISSFVYHSNHETCIPSSTSFLRNNMNSLNITYIGQELKYYYNKHFSIFNIHFIIKLRELKNLISPFTDLIFKLLHLKHNIFYLILIYIKKRVVFAINNKIQSILNLYPNNCMINKDYKNSIMYSKKFINCFIFSNNIRLTFNNDIFILQFFLTQGLAAYKENKETKKLTLRYAYWEITHKYYSNYPIFSYNLKKTIKSERFKSHSEIKLYDIYSLYSNSIHFKSKIAKSFMFFYFYHSVLKLSWLYLHYSNFENMIEQISSLLIRNKKMSFYTPFITNILYLNYEEFTINNHNFNYFHIIDSIVIYQKEALNLTHLYYLVTIFQTILPPFNSFMINKKKMVKEKKSIKACNNVYYYPLKENSLESNNNKTISVFYSNKTIYNNFIVFKNILNRINLYNYKIILKYFILRNKNMEKSINKKLFYKKVINCFCYYYNGLNFSHKFINYIRRKNKPLNLFSDIISYSYTLSLSTIRLNTFIVRYRPGNKNLKKISHSPARHLKLYILINRMKIKKYILINNKGIIKKSLITSLIYINFNLISLLLGFINFSFLHSIYYEFDIKPKKNNISKNNISLSTILNRVVTTNINSKKDKYIQKLSLLYLQIASIFPKLILVNFNANKKRGLILYFKFILHSDIYSINTKSFKFLEKYYFFYATLYLCFSVELFFNYSSILLNVLILTNGCCSIQKTNEKTKTGRNHYLSLFTIIINQLIEKNILKYTFYIKHEKMIRNLVSDKRLFKFIRKKSRIIRISMIYEFFLSQLKTVFLYCEISNMETRLAFKKYFLFYLLDSFVFLLFIMSNLNKTFFFKHFFKVASYITLSFNLQNIGKLKLVYLHAMFIAIFYLKSVIFSNSSLADKLQNISKDEIYQHKILKISQTHLKIRNSISTSVLFSREKKNSSSFIL